MTGLRALLLVWPVSYLVSAVLQHPTNLRIISHNFQHILMWEDPNNESGISYKVECAYRGRNVCRDCCNITRRQCDLTKDFTDVTYSYSASVCSFRGGDVSLRAWSKIFTPVSDTVLGPALMDVVADNNSSIRVFIQPPISHLWSEEEQRNVSMLDDLVTLSYDVQLNYTGEQVQLRTIQTYTGEDNVTFSNLLPRTNYCVSVTKVRSRLITHNYSIPSSPKCVITGPVTIEEHNPEAGGSKAEIIVPVVCVFLLFILVGVFIALDKAGYICMRRKFFPKVLDSLPRSESVFSRSSECTSPTYVLPVEVVSQKEMVEGKQESEDKYCEEGYASRKKLLDSDTSSGNSSGLNPSTIMSSSEFSGQATSSSGDERIPSDNSANLQIVSDLDESWSSHTPLPVDALVPSPNLQFNKNEVFNINLNSISIADAGEVWTDLSQGGSLKEEPEHHINSGQDGVPPNADVLICPSIALDSMELSVMDEELGSGDEEGDPSDNGDSDDQVVSGYMRR